MLTLSPTCTFTRFFIVLPRLVMSKVFAIANDMKNVGYESHVCTMLIIVTYNMLIGLHNKSLMTQETLVILKKCMMLGAIPSMISSFNGLLTLTYMWEVAMAILLDMEVVVCNPQTTHSIAIQFHIENKNFHSLIVRLHTNNCGYINTLQCFYNFSFQQKYIKIFKK